MTTQTAQHDTNPLVPVWTQYDAGESPPAQMIRIARALSKALLDNVRNAATLNVSAARALLLHAPISMPKRVAEQSENWRWSWRSFEVCASAAEQVLSLTHSHVERSTEAVWQAADHLHEKLSPFARSGQLRASFDALRDSQAEHWRAAQQARAELVALAQTPGTSTTVLRPLALLARTLSEAFLATVQNTTSLNLSAAQALLAQAGLPSPQGVDPLRDSWRWSWRSFEVCATSADQVLNITRGHVERTTSALWRASEQILQELGSAHHVAPLRASFEELRATQTAYWNAAQRAHGEILVALALICANTLTHESDTPGRIHATH
jgi:hypothetical protein